MSPEDCAAVGMSNKAAAVVLWRSQVTYQADWDHKLHGTGRRTASLFDWEFNFTKHEKR